MPQINDEIVTPHTRAAEFPDFYVENGQLFCKYCSHSVTYSKKSTVLSHVRSKKHLKLKEKGNPRRQTTVTTLVNSFQTRNQFVKDFVKMCVAANIPLEKATRMQPFIKKYCREGGTLTTSKNLRENYIPCVADELRTKIEGIINEIKSEHAVFSINIDETTDEKERHVLNTILAVKGQSFLVSTEVLDHAANHQSLAKSVNRIIQKFGLEDHVIVYITDNTGYCSKSYRQFSR